jgi:chromosomal replication initiation ATPase DnaA
VSNPWNDILERLRQECSEEDFRRWFGATTYASDSGDQITVWVPTEGIRRHIELHYADKISRARRAIGRDNTVMRFVVAGFDDDDDHDI